MGELLLIADSAANLVPKRLSIFALFRAISLLHLFEGYAPRNWRE